MPPESKPRFYLPELDGLRFIAFLLVFIHNAHPILKGTFLEKFSEYSWFGVDLFFCLSGFLITKLLAMEHEQTGKINIRNFYVRRTLRIWPLYFVFILFTISITQIHQGWGTILFTRAVGLATFTDNLVSAILGLNFIEYSIHLWTISFEEQFYFLAPWLILCIIGKPKKVQQIIIGLILIFGLTIRAIFINFHAASTAIYVLPFTHFESILAGMLLGLGLLDIKQKRISNFLLLLLGVLCFVIVYQFPNKEIVGWNLMLTYFLVGIGSLLIVSTVMARSRLLVVINHSFIIYLGKISYGMYIYHLFCLVMVTNFFLYQINASMVNSYFLPWIILVSGLSITILISSISYLVIEKPFLQLKKKFSTIQPRPM